MKEGLLKKGIGKKLLSFVVALTMVISLMLMSSITAYAYDSLPAQLNGYNVSWTGTWEIDGIDIRCGNCTSGSGRVNFNGSLTNILNDEVMMMIRVADLTAGTYTCQCGGSSFTLSAAGSGGTEEVCKYCGHVKSQHYTNFNGNKTTITSDLEMVLGCDSCSQTRECAYGDTWQQCKSNNSGGSGGFRRCRRKSRNQGSGTFKL